MRCASTSRRFEPTATAFVANLPYHVAAPLVLDSIGGLPAIERWCVLVQREIAERLTPGPAMRSTAGRACSARSRSSRPAGTTSRAACSCRCRTSTRRWSRSRAGRSGRSSRATGRRSSRPCARRSPTAARRSSTRSPRPAGGTIARPWRRPAGRPASIPARAPRRCPPEAFLALARAGGLTCSPGQDQSQPARRPAARRRLPRLATVLAALPLGDELELEPAAVTRVEAPAAGRRGHARDTRARPARGAAHRPRRRAGAFRSTSACPSGATRRRQRRRRGGARGSRTRRWPSPSRTEQLIAVAAAVGSDVPFFASGSETALARGRGEALERCRVGRARLGVRGLAGSLLWTAQVYAALPPARRPPSAWHAGRRPVRVADVEQLAALVENDSGPPPAALPASASLRAALPGQGARGPSVSGSGSAMFGLFAIEAAAQAPWERVRGSAPWTGIARLPRATRR